MICTCSHVTGCECHLKLDAAVGTLTPGTRVRFEYPQFDTITGDYTHDEARELAVETVKDCKNGSKVVVGLKLAPDGTTQYRSYHINLMRNVEVAG